MITVRSISLRNCHGHAGPIRADRRATGPAARPDGTGRGLLLRGGREVVEGDAVDRLGREVRLDPGPDLRRRGGRPPAAEPSTEATTRDVVMDLAGADVSLELGE